MQKDKKKILFIVQLPPPVHGTSVMNEFAFKSKKIRSEFNCDILPMQFASSVSDMGTFSIRKIRLMIVFCFSLLGKLLQFRPHVVYFTIAPIGGAFFRDALFSFIVNCFGVKRLFHLHGKGIDKEAATSSFKRFVYRFTFRHSQVIVLAPSLKEDIKSVFNGSAFVLPNGIREKKCNEEHVAGSTPTFLFLSNLVKSKGIYIFLDALHQLQQNGTPFNATIVGAPFDVTIEEVNQYIRNHGLTQKVQVIGPLYGEEKLKILCTASVLVFPTYYANEAFPLTILEAMQAGLPVISSNNGAIREMIEDGVTGYVTPMNDTTSVAEKMQYLAENESVRTSMAQKAKEKFARSYTLELFEQRLLDIFKQVTS